MYRQISCRQVEVGMFIEGFGGPWLRHPFWRSKFLLESKADVERVRCSGVPYVVIDLGKGRGLLERATPTTARTVSAALLSKPARRTGISMATHEEERRDTDRAQAATLVRRAKTRIKGIFEASRLGHAVRCSEVAPIVEEVTKSVEKNAHAMLGVVRLKNKDEYTYMHSVAVCTLMVNLARHIGLDDGQIRNFGTAGLLHDIGKIGISDEILNKPGKLTEAETVIMREHPEHGHRLLSATPDMIDTALDVCLHHHEKIDGTGYPFHLPGEALSLAARAGAICDIYDALTSDRIYKAGWTPVEAISAMWSWEGHLDRTLLFNFMQSIGVFPSGLLVRLRSNRLAIVLDNGRRCSRPRVCAFYATRTHEWLERETLVIRNDLSGDQILAIEEPATWGLAPWEEIADRLARGLDPRPDR